MKTTTNRTAADLKIACLEETLESAIEQANRYGLRSQHLRVRAIREEMADVRAGR